MTVASQQWYSRLVKRWRKQMTDSYDAVVVLPLLVQPQGVPLSRSDILTIVCALADAAECLVEKGFVYTAKDYRELADRLRPVVLKEKE
jgi:hypothetical protein